MCLSNEAAAIKLAERDNLVGELVVAAESALNYIENTESELGIKLKSGDLLRAALAKAREGAQS